MRKTGSYFSKLAAIIPPSILFLFSPNVAQAKSSEKPVKPWLQESKIRKEIEDDYRAGKRAVDLLKQLTDREEIDEKKERKEWFQEFEEVAESMKEVTEMPNYQWKLKQGKRGVNFLKRYMDYLLSLDGNMLVTFNAKDCELKREYEELMGIESEDHFISNPLTNVLSYIEDSLQEVVNSAPYGTRKRVKYQLKSLEEDIKEVSDIIDDEDGSVGLHDTPPDLKSLFRTSMNREYREDKYEKLMNYFTDFERVLSSLEAEVEADLKEIEQLNQSLCYWTGESNYNVILTTPEGDDAVPATDTWALDTICDLSPDASRVAFHSDYEDGYRDIYVKDLVSEERKRLTDFDSIDLFPSFSPDGEQIAYIKNFDVWVMDADGSNKRQLTDDAEVNGYGHNPNQFRPRGIARGRRIVWLGGEDPIVGREESGNASSYHYKFTVTNNYPTWSPDGRLIAYDSDKHGDRDIWITDLQGKVDKRITGEGGKESSPEWLPRGRKLAYISKKDGKRNIYLADVSDMDRIETERIEVERSPSHVAWSPEGDKIAYTDWDSGDIYLKNLDSGEERKIGDGIIADWE